MDNQTSTIAARYSTCGQMAPLESDALPDLGLSLSALRAFVTSCGGDKGLRFPDGSRMATSQVLQHFVLPRTADARLSYCDMLRATEPHGVAKATVFISHAWRFEFFAVFEALERHFSGAGAEEGAIIQETIGSKMPLLGFYSGV